MMDTTIIYNDYLSGDAKALERLMEIYGDKLTLYINGYIKNLHDSEDLLIEVFAYLISKRPNIKSSFESYIYKAARNHALMFLRKAKRHIILTEEEMNFCIENTSSSSLRCEDVITQHCSGLWIRKNNQFPAYEKKIMRTSCTQRASPKSPRLFRRNCHTLGTLVLMIINCR